MELGEGENVSEDKVENEENFPATEKPKVPTFICQNALFQRIWTIFFFTLLMVQLILAAMQYAVLYQAHEDLSAKNCPLGIPESGMCFVEFLEFGY